MKYVSLIAIFHLAYLLSLNARVLYVHQTAAGTGDGMSWVNAFTDLQDALAIAQTGDEIWVAAGTYIPGESREDTFRLVREAALYGGFNGTESSRDERDWVANRTVLSGDVNGDDIGFSNNTENVYHVVTGATDAILDGFTITGGNAIEGSFSSGGGMLNRFVTLMVRNCCFVKNFATRNGAGMYNQSSSITVEDCVFAENVAESGDGGGLYTGGRSPSIAIVHNCIFRDNSAQRGGGVRSSSHGSISNTIFLNNTGTSLGGGMVKDSRISPIVNCLFFNNSSPFATAASFSSSSDVASNTIFWNNNAGQSTDMIRGVATFTHCNIRHSGGSGASWASPGVDGGGNIDRDPLFFDGSNPDGPDDVFGTLDDGLRLQSTSPCIDAGTSASAPEIDVRGFFRNQGTGVDIGAYEFLTGEPVARDDSSETSMNRSVTISVLDNDVDYDGTLDLTSLNLVSVLFPRFVPQFGAGVVMWTDLELDGTPMISKFIRFKTIDTRGVLFDTEFGAGADGGLAMIGGRLVLRCAFHDSGLQMIDIVSDDVAADGNWHSAGFTYDGSTLVTYFDGVPAGVPITIRGDTIRHNYVSVCGRRTLSNTVFLNGTLADFAVYNIALTPREVLRYHNGTFREENLVLLGRMNERGYGGGLFDSSGNGNGGTLHGHAIPKLDSTIVNFAPAEGTLTNNEDGTVTYTPRDGFFGPDGFGYTVADNDGLVTDTAIVSISIKSPPVAVDDKLEIVEDESVLVDVVANDVSDDSEIVPESVRIRDPRPPVNGTVMNNGDGTITYTPNLDFIGEISFEYTVEDLLGAVSNIGTVRVTIQPSNAVPIAEDDRAEVSEGRGIEIDLVNNDLDVDGEIVPSSIEIVEPGRSASFDGVDDKVVWGDLGLNGVSRLSKFIRFRTTDTSGVLFDVEFGQGHDGGVYLAGGMLRVRCAFQDSGTQVMDIVSDTFAADGNVHTAGFTYDGTMLTAYFDGEVSGTPVAISADTIRHDYPSTCGSRIFSSSRFYQGELSDFVVYDRALSEDDVLEYHNSNVPTSNLVLWGKMDERDYSDGLADSSGRGHSGTADGVTSVFDVNFPLNGELVNNSDGTLSYTPNRGFSGEVILAYTVRDNLGARSNRAQVGITVHPSNATPLARDDRAESFEGQSVRVNVVKNDSDADGSIDATGVELISSRNVANFDGVDDRIIWGDLGLIKVTQLSKFIRFRTTDTRGVLFDVEFGNGADGGLYIAGGMMRLRCAFNDSGTQVIDVVSDAVAADGHWHSAGFVYDGNTLTTYFDGVATGTPVSIPDDTVLHDYPSVVGGRVFSNSLFFAGELSDFVVYNQALAGSDAENFHSGGLPSNGLVLRGKMDESDYSEGLVDSSGNGNTGSSDGAVPVVTDGLDGAPSHGMVVNNGDGRITYTPNSGFIGTDSFDYTVADDRGAVSTRATVTVVVRRRTPAVTAGKLYWLDNSPRRIRRSDLDGSNIEDIFTFSADVFPRRLVLDSVGGKLYWSDVQERDRLLRANLDGSDVEILFRTLGLDAFALDERKGHVYWTDTFGFSILKQSNLDGSDPRNISIENIGSGFDLAVDVSESKIYWPHSGRDIRSIRRANLDGTDIEDTIVFEGRPSVREIALDAGREKIYWVNGTTNTIQRANFDGTDVEIIVELGTFGGGIALDRVANTMFWVRNNKIWRANLDGTDVEELISEGVASPRSLAIMKPVMQPTVNFSRSGSTADEAASRHEIVVELQAPAGRLEEVITVDVADTGVGTAQNGIDYGTFSPIALIFPAGSADGATQSFFLDILNDELTEGDETFALRLTNIQGPALLGSPRVHKIQLTDDDTGNIRPVATDDAGETTPGNRITLNVTANDRDSDGTIRSSTVQIVEPRYVAGFDGFSEPLSGRFDKIVWGNLDLNGTPLISKFIRFRTTDRECILFDTEFGGNADGGVSISGGFLQVRCSFFRTGTLVIQMADDSAAADGAWHSVGFIYDGIELKAYFDGIQAEETHRVFGDTIRHNYPTTCGARSQGSGFLLAGEIADFVVYNTALTVVDVANYHQGVVRETGLVLWGKMDEDDYADGLADSSGNGHMGTSESAFPVLDPLATPKPEHGTVVNNGDGTVTYTPNSGFIGVDSFDYTVEDNDGAVSNVATVTVTVAPTATASLSRFPISQVGERRNGSSDHLGFDAMGPGSILSQTVYEDAEDGMVTGWQAYGDGAVVNLGDEVGNRIISTTGKFPVDSFRLGLKDGSDWNNTEEFTASFTILMNDEAAVYFRVDTTDGEKYLCYRPGPQGIDISDSVICFGLGIDSDGEWHVISRDLLKDLRKALPEISLLSVKDFYAFGKIRLDNLLLLDVGK